MKLLQAILRVSSSNNSDVGGGDGNKHDPAQALAENMADNYYSDAKEELTVLEGWKWWDDGEVVD